MTGEKGPGEKGRPGPLRGSMNALKTGRNINTKRLVVGELPPKMIAIKRESRKYRRTLEAEVAEVHGEISTTHAHLIDTASAATVQAGICRWLLRHRLEKMSTADIRGCSADIVKAKERRDAAVKALELERPPEDPWANLLTATEVKNADT